MALTQKQIDTLQEILLSGEKSSSYSPDGSRSVQYRDQDELFALLRQAQGELDALPPHIRFQLRRTVVSSNRDLGQPAAVDRTSWRS